MKDFISAFQKALLTWHSVTARDLPWRGETDVYRIWISEIMLQQTRTETVKGYYAKFLKAFPDVFVLADADQSDVIKMWEGLGYYSRARNLHAAAKIVAYERNGVFPDTLPGLKALPGIGDYAAGAIASIAFGFPEPALDGNQARVLSRVLGITEEIKTPQSLYERAVELVPACNPGEYNQALMGLGAMVCLAGKPKCDKCPVREMCAAYRLGLQGEIPKKKEKAKRRIEKRAIALVLDEAGRVYVQKRTEGLLIGLWEFPGFKDARTISDTGACLEEMGFSVKPVGEIGKAKHVFTHLEWHMTGYLFKLVSAPSGSAFEDKKGIESLAMPTALKTFRDYYTEGKTDGIQEKDDASDRMDRH